MYLNFLSFYANINYTPKQDIIGDWNAKLGNKAESNVGKFGLVVRNEGGDWLVNFYKVNNLSIANTS